MPDSQERSPRYSTTLAPVPPRLALSVALTSVPIFLLIAVFTFWNGDSILVVVLAGVLLFSPPLLLTRLRFDVELTASEFRYRLRPWHRRARTVSRSEITQVRVCGPDPTSLDGRRLPLGRGWVAWTAEEVQYAFGGERGVRVESENETVELWFDGAEELARELETAASR